MFTVYWNCVFQTGIVKLEEENAILRLILNKMSARIPTEVISDGSGEEEMCEELEGGMVVNTSHYQIDGMFATKYYFMSNVSLQLSNFLNQLAN